MRTEAYVIVRCDKCGIETKARLLDAVGMTTGIPKWSTRSVPPDLQEQGWHTVDDQDICPSCFKTS